jgi:phosphatidylglycerol:prolipoprotein diacylglycerol transferase
MNFLHNYHPGSLLISFGLIHIYWYGFFIIIGIILGLALSLKLAEYYEIKKDDLIDLAFYLILGGIAGARIYDVFLSWDYYQNHLWDIFKIWQGGLAIHGAIILGAIIIFYFSKKKKINFWLLAFLITPSLALAQAIGRWGNYFNQELFGRPTNLPWGIPIDVYHRPLEYIDKIYFHPTFLYESLGDFLIFIILIAAHILIIQKKQKGAEQKELTENYIAGFTIYGFLYSLLRFSLEFIRIDKAPVLFNLRWPQIFSLAVMGIVTIFIFKKVWYNKFNVKLKYQNEK